MVVTLTGRQIGSEVVLEVGRTWKKNNHSGIMWDGKNINKSKPISSIRMIKLVDAFLNTLRCIHMYICCWILKNGKRSLKLDKALEAPSITLSLEKNMLFLGGFFCRSVFLNILFSHCGSVSLTFFLTLLKVLALPFIRYQAYGGMGSYLGIMEVTMIPSPIVWGLNIRNMRSESCLHRFMKRL